MSELARVAELAGLPGETLARLAARMERRELRPGEQLAVDDSVGVVVSGLVGGETGLLRPGDTFDGPVTATTPATVVTCDRLGYEELVRSR